MSEPVEYKTYGEPAVELPGGWYTKSDLQDLIDAMDHIAEMNPLDGETK